MKRILNIAAGKCMPIDMPSKDRLFLVNLDLMYAHAQDLAKVEDINSRIEQAEAGDDAMKQLTEDKLFLFKVNMDAFKFMEQVSFKFDEITCYRFLEHVDKDRVLYFIYLMSSCLKVGGTVDIVVPDYNNLCQRVLDEEPGAEGWEAHDILVTTEIVNHPSDPHASIWTGKRLKHFFTLEGRFKTLSLVTYYMFDGRDIYIRYQAERIK